ncbi:hypothetical protein G7Y89_g1636 [Cudoniella acicularis]|uniref:Rhodopsin domain-containing protein n=1 Tax=Cudoniella acicularis TaxID=354080 RepID=A0A8H4W6T5_9HELO|nr:hypothetical protein G7Y89_g1636 [Cudoniella acicularis]
MDSTTPPDLEAYLAEDSGSKIINVVIVFGVLEVLFVWLFWAARVRMGTARGMDTYLMIPAFILAFANLVIGIVSVRYAGLGRHWLWVAQSPVMIERFLKLQLALTILNAPAKAFPKLAILCLYLRVFSTKAYRYATFAVAGIIIATWIASNIRSFVMCVPFAYQWDKTIAGGRCLNEFAFFTWITVPDFVIDSIMIILPLPIVWQLQTTLCQKIGLTVTFVAGGVGIFTSVIRFVVLIDFRDPESDLSWKAVTVVTWTIIVPGMYLIAACLPSLRPVLLPYFNSLDLQNAPARVRSILGMQTRYSITTDAENAGLSGIRRPPRAKTRERSRDGNSDSKNSEDRVWKGTFGDSGQVNCYRQSLSEDSERIQAIREDINAFHHSIIVEKAFTISTEPRVL